MTVTMKCGTAGLVKGETVTIIDQDDPFVTIPDGTGHVHLVLTGYLEVAA